MRQVRVELDRAERPIVSVVIPHYLKYSFLDSCLASIYRHGARCSFEVIVVANGSPAENIDQLQAWRPNVRIVTLRPNQGFARACNAGARAARGKYVVFLNDDTTVTPGWLDEMVGLVERDRRIGITGPKLLYPENDCIQHCGTVFNERGFGEHIYRLLPSKFVGANRVRYYRALTGACLLIERDFFAMLGQFEPSYHGTGGCEDTDLCFKVLEQGKMVAYCPSSVVYHHEGVTRGRRDEHHPEEIHNRNILRQRWGKYLGPDISDYYLLAEIEAEERTAWNWLQNVPAEIVARYDSPERRAVGRTPFKIQIGSGVRPEAGYLHLDAAPDAPSVALVHDVMEPLPFVDESVGEILANDIIAHVPPERLPRVLGEFHRILSKGGVLMIRDGAENHIRSANGFESCTGKSTDLSRHDGRLPIATPGLAADYSRDPRGNYPDLSIIDGECLAALCQVIGFAEARFESVADERLTDGSRVVALR